MKTATPPWTLLAVDDVPNILAALRRVFRATGSRILTVSGAEEALALLATQPVDAVLSDMRMPDMNGAQLLEQVSRNWARTARLLLTGQADQGLDDRRDQPRPASPIHRQTLERRRTGARPATGRRTATTRSGQTRARTDHSTAEPN